MIEVELTAVTLEDSSNTPMVILREIAQPTRSMSIFIGHPEATAIAFVLENVEAPRPLTHDLFKNVLEALDIDLDHIVISDLRDSTFYAELHLSNDDETWVVSCRPSDALALAVRLDCAIYVEEAVLDEAGVLDEVFVESSVAIDGNPEEVVQEFRQFIDSVNPEDFAS